MNKRTRMVLVLCCLLLLAVGGMAALHVLALPRPRSTWDVLSAMVRKDAPVSQAQRQQEELRLAPLAKESAEFRKWLVSVVTSDDVEMKIREAALMPFWKLESDEDVKDAAQAFVPWLEERPRDHRERGLQHTVRIGMFELSLLETDLPAEEILELVERGWPEWRLIRLAHADPQSPQTALSSYGDQQKRAARYMEVLALARSRDAARLMARLKAEAHLPEGKQITVEDLPGLAESDPAFRKWLAGVVASVDEDHWVRGVAFKALLDMERDDAVRDLVADLHPWLRAKDPERDYLGRGQRKQIAGFLLDRLLLTDLPIEEVLELATRSLPSWDIWAGEARRGRDGAPWSDEQQARVRERLGKLMYWWKGEPARRAAQ